MSHTFVGPDGRCYQLGAEGVKATDALMNLDVHNFMPPGGVSDDVDGSATMFSPQQVQEGKLLCLDDTDASVTMFRA